MSSISDHFEMMDVDKIAAQMVSLFRSDENLMGWTNGVIYRSSMMQSIPDFPPPQIVVAAEREGETPEPSSKGSVALDVSVLVLWEDNAIILEEDEPSMISLVQYLKGILQESYYLNEPPISERIVRRLDQFEPVDYGGVEVDGATIRYLIIGARYISNISARSRKKACYP